PDAPGIAAPAPTAHASPDGPDLSAADVTVPLGQLAWVRSGDKGHLFNVAVIARRADYLPWLRAALSPQAVGLWDRHLRAEGPPRVERFEAHGLNALNFVVHDALEGGINASTQLDPAAKGMGQMLLRFGVRIPAALAAHCTVAGTTAVSGDEP